jgi:hypothetical protein
MNDSPGVIMQRAASRCRILHTNPQKTSINQPILMA